MAIDRALSRQVPTCPDWNLCQLAAHVGQAHRLGVDIVRRRLSIINSPGVAAHRPELAEPLRGHGQTLHLHATDPPSLGESGEWVIRRGPDALSWEHAHGKADVVVRGPAGEFLLALLGRIPTDDQRLDVVGNTGLFEHWVRHVTF